MRAHLVVMPPPALDHDLRLGPRPEPLQAQALVAELAVEALRRAILPGLAGIDQRRVDALLVIQVSSARETNSGPLSERR